MTVPGWGRVTPSQMFMLMLAGHDLRHPRMPNQTPSEEDRLKAMALGRQRLASLTGQDFGYDLGRWHEYLLGTKEHGYKHPYAWRTVRPAIEKALGDAERLRLIKRLEQTPRQLSSEGLAALLIDALVDASLVDKEKVRFAVDIAREEIDVRKALGDY